VSHSSRDSIEALAMKTWLERAEPGLVGEVFVDLDPDTGIPAGCGGRGLCEVPMADRLGRG
jgi:hypothetical protein